MDIDTGILIAILVFVAAEFFTMREWKGEIKEWKKGVDKWKEGVDKKLTEIFQALSSKTVSGASPRSLTPLGKAISEQLGAADWAREEAESIFYLLPNRRPYEVQEFASDYVHGGKFNDIDLVLRMEDCAYNRGINTFEVRDVFAVELRDALLDFDASGYRATE